MGPSKALITLMTIDVAVREKAVRDSTVADEAQNRTTGCRLGDREAQRGVER